MEIEFLIQHHPARAALLPRLLGQIPRARVVSDPLPDGPRNAWRTYRACLEAVSADSTHVCILQDDATVCADFAAVLESAVAAMPDRMLVLCVCGQPNVYVVRMSRASARGASWALLEPLRWVPVVAVVWPARLVAPALRFVDEQGWTPKFVADDEIVGRIARGLGEQVFATVPSLVQHEDLVPSVAGRRSAGGRNAARVAPCFVGDMDCDPLLIDWSLGA